MISEIVRSKINIDNGARTRFANMFHGLLLLVFTGFRLASPREFVHMYRLGKDQCLIFVSTIVGVLATDLLTGIAIGILVKFVLHALRGAPLRSLYKLNAEVTQEDDHSATIVVRDSAIFSTWIPLRKHLHRLLQAGKRVTLNLSETRLVDHTVMGKLQEWKTEFAEQDSELSVTGLERHRPLSDSPVAVHTRPGT